MFVVFPWLPWLAAIVSGVLLVALWVECELSGRGGTILIAWFLVAAYCQFFTLSAGVSVAGLALQTILAIYLIIRWKIQSTAT
jgi:hypothetical protein